MTESNSDSMENRDLPIVSTQLALDPEFLPILREYVLGIGRRINDIEMAASCHDNAALARHAHALKGSSGLYGYPLLSGVAGEIERRSLAGEGCGCSDLFLELNQIYERIKKGMETL